MDLQESDLEQQKQNKYFKKVLFGAAGLVIFIAGFAGGIAFGLQNGSSGQVVGINASIVVIKNKEGTEENILIDGQTTIRKNLTDIKITDLAVNDQIVVIGAPRENGEIQAKFIRVITGN